QGGQGHGVGGKRLCNLSNIIVKLRSERNQRKGNSGGNLHSQATDTTTVSGHQAQGVRKDEQSYEEPGGQRAGHNQDFIEEKIPTYEWKRTQVRCMEKNSNTMQGGRWSTPRRGEELCGSKKKTQGQSRVAQT
ncbi:hypothetical protein P7K49_029511, partial [Saguinus oedipus]